MAHFWDADSVHPIHIVRGVADAKLQKEEDQATRDEREEHEERERARPPNPVSRKRKTRQPFSASLLGERVQVDPDDLHQPKRRVRYAASEEEEDEEEDGAVPEYERHRLSFNGNTARRFHMRRARAVQEDADQQRTSTEATPFPDDLTGPIDTSARTSYMYPLASGQNILRGRRVDDYSDNPEFRAEWLQTPPADTTKFDALYEEARQEDQDSGVLTREFLNHAVLRHKMLESKPLYHLIVKEFGAAVGLNKPELLIDQQIFQNAVRSVENDIRQEIQNADRREQQRKTQTEILEENLKSFQQEQALWNTLQAYRIFRYASFRRVPSIVLEELEKLDPKPGRDASAAETRRKRTVELLEKYAKARIFPPVVGPVPFDKYKVMGLLETYFGVEGDANVSRALEKGLTRHNLDQLNTVFPFPGTSTAEKYTILNNAIMIGRRGSAATDEITGLFSRVVAWFKQITKADVNTREQFQERLSDPLIADTYPDEISEIMDGEPRIIEVAPATGGSSSSTDTVSRADDSKQIMAKLRIKAKKIAVLIVGKKFQEFLKYLNDELVKEKNLNSINSTFLTDDGTNLDLYVLQRQSYIHRIFSVAESIEDAAKDQRDASFFRFGTSVDRIQMIHKVAPAVYDRSEGVWFTVGVAPDPVEGYEAATIEETRKLVASREATLYAIDVMWDNLVSLVVTADTNTLLQNADFTEELANVIQGADASSTLRALFLDVYRITREDPDDDNNGEEESKGRDGRRTSPFIGQVDTFGNITAPSENILRTYADADTAFAFDADRMSVAPSPAEVYAAAATSARGEDGPESRSTPSKRETDSKASQALPAFSDADSLATKWFSDFASYLNAPLQGIFMSVASRFIQAVFAPSRISIHELAEFGASLLLIIMARSDARLEDRLGDTLQEKLSYLLANFDTNLKALQATPGLSNKPALDQFIRTLPTLKTVIRLGHVSCIAVNLKAHVYLDVRIGVIYGFVLQELALGTFSLILRAVSNAKLSIVVKMQAEKQRMLGEIVNGKAFSARNDLDKRLNEIIVKGATLSDPSNTEIVFFRPSVMRAFREAEDWVRRNAPFLMNCPEMRNWEWTSLIKDTNTVNEDFATLFVAIAAWHFSDIEFAASKRIATTVNSRKHEIVDDYKLRQRCANYTLLPRTKIPVRFS